MKKLIIFTVIIFGIQSINLAKGNAKDSIIVEIQNLPPTDTTIIGSDSLLNIKLKVFKSPDKYCADTIDGIEWIFIFCPLILLIFFTITFALGINKTSTNQGFFQAMIEEGNNGDTYIAPSKFIAFLSGIAATIISLFVLSFYAYMLAAQCSNELDIGELWKLAVALGIGIIPYGYYILRKS